MFWAHPRVCGEHVGNVASAVKGLGSSPRLRGAPMLARVSPSCGRLIPASAGSTLADKHFWQG